MISRRTLLKTGAAVAVVLALPPPVRGVPAAPPEPEPDYDFNTISITSSATVALSSWTVAVGV